MTKKTETTAKAETAKVTETVTAVEENKIVDRVADGAREFVKRSTATAKERADGAFETAQKYNSDLEGMLVRAAKGYTNVLSNIAEAAFVNVNRGINAAEKIADAKSLSDAMQIQNEYVREQSTCSMNNTRAAIEYVRSVATENGEALRDTTAKIWNSQKAA
jgi:hypothetical protein